MEQKGHYLDKLSLVKLLEVMAVAVESKKKLKKNIYPIEESLNEFLKESKLSKKQLIEKWIQIAGKEAYENLCVNTVKEYYKKLAIVLQSGAIYLNKTKDPLYLIAELSILTDWYLYGKISLEDD